MHGINAIHSIFMNIKELMTDISFLLLVSFEEGIKNVAYLEEKSEMLS